MNSAYHRRVAFPIDLGNSTSRQLHQTSPALIIPIGSTEQHGPHLPLDTDTRIATAVAEALTVRLRAAGPADAAGAWQVAPPVCYGASGEHEGFPGTISIGEAALTDLVVEFGRSACRWASRLLFVNGHGGNVAALRRATTLLRHEGRDAAWCSCVSRNADAHAGHTETSVLLHIAPAVVNTQDRVRGNTAPLSELMPALREGGVAAVSPVGVLGDPTTATAHEGSRILAEMVDACWARVTRWRPDNGGMLT
ncbi:mycofactocin biosynthesis peptidyl-dipeptidase MftE [Mycobacterium sp. SMC-4]|uniref:mycofactocin biosynthesis peptidyl-dipeptidase MftE n=1 Tax=Mycobacterium sp. SMC-4 TaxID=2857059 RepID=UPI0021B2C056|nr:mycofactocin biosynthesis peptidyl-dipeptidase MftE [Mycobacterium sp. SMC-4]UXA18920.1 mycofactocin biosynthesis peptidyl-dipeptidase MftE [Mycobacterium sp. SMC-4]